MKRFFAGCLVVAGLMMPAVSYATEQTVELAVANMSCVSCPFIVKNALGAVAGVSKVAVSYQDKTATVIFDDSRTSAAALTQASAKAGFPATVIEKE